MSVLEQTNLTGTGRSAFGNLLKTVYGPLWQLHVHTKVVIWTLIGKPKGRMAGKTTLNAVVDRLPQSSGISALEYWDLPTPKSLNAFQPEMHQKDLYLRLQWTGQVERAAAGGNQNAWAQPAVYELQLARRQFMLNVARKSYVGYYDILGQFDEAYEATGGGASTQVGLEPRSTRDSAANDFFHFGTHYLRAGMDFSVLAANDADAGITDEHTSATTNRFGVATIDASDPADPFITVTENGYGHPTAVDNGYLVPYASRLSAGTDSPNMTAITTANKESAFASFNGLANLALDTNIYDVQYTLDRSGGLYPTLEGKRANNSGTNRAFSELLITLLCDRISDEGTGREPDRLVCHRSVRREVVKENRNLRQFPVIQTSSGFGALTFSSGDHRMPYIVDRDCMPGLVWALDAGLFGWLTNSSMGPLGSGDKRFVNSKDAYEINMHMSGNCMTTAPYCHGAVEDITYDTQALVP